jgi:hypothetical protein
MRRADGLAQALIDAGRICPVVIASAFIGNSYGVDSTPAEDQFDHGRYAAYLVDELPGLEWFLGDGSEDYGWIRSATVEFARRLAARGVDVPVRTAPGGHDNGTWRRLTAPMLEMLLAPPCPTGPAATASDPRPSH